MKNDRQRVAERFAGVGLADDRFINVVDGEKGTRDHDTRYSDPRDVPGRNYGIYPGDGLLDVDIDDYGDDATDEGLDAILELPETLTVESPHTDGEPGGHRYYHVTTDRSVDSFDVEAVLATVAEQTAEAARDDPVALALAEAFGTPNPQPSWGEVRAVNQYVVGPGSKLDGCDKDWCDECEMPEGGRYTIDTDRPIATIDAGTFVDALRRDPVLKEQGEQHPVMTNCGVAVASPGSAAPGGSDEYDPAGTDVSTFIEHETKVATYLAAGAKAAGFTDRSGESDRSKADFHVCCRAIEYGVAEGEVRSALEESGHTKASERDDRYWRRTWSRALSAADVEPNSRARTDTEPEFRPKQIASLAGAESVNDLNDRQRAYYLTKQIAMSDEVHLLAAQPDGTLYRFDDGVWTETGEQLLRELGHRALAAAYGSKTHGELCERIRATRPVPREELGTPPRTVAVKNGLLDLEARKVTNLVPEDFALTRLPVTYDQDATASRWDEFIEEVVEPDRCDAIQEFVGYCLLVGELPINRALMLVGEGSNGKSTFLRVVKALLGEENITAHSLQGLARSEHNVADLYGTVANICADLSSEAIGDGGMFKTLVGDDSVTGRRLYQKPFSFEATAKQLYSANQVPDVNIDDEAFFRRWLLVEFPTQFTHPGTPGPDKDPELTDKLLKELPGILNWALDGYERLMTQGHFTYEGDPLDKRDRWLSWGDSLSKFIDECVVTSADRKWRAGDVHVRYSAWCRETLDEEPEAQQTLTKELKKCEGVQYGNYRFDGSRDRGLKGFDLSNDVPAAPDAGDEADSQQTALPQGQAIETVLTTVRNLEADRDSPIPRADVVDEVGLDEDRAHRYLDKLLTEGKLYEPRDGVVATQ